MMRKCIPYIIIAVLLLYIICIGRNGRGEPGTYADTVTYVDTIQYYEPIPKDSMVVRYVSVSVPKVADSVPKIAEFVPKVADSVQKDSVIVQIPITQKIYEDSTYKAYVSGFRPNLDSLIVYPRRQVVTIAPPKVKPHRWHIGPSVGVGVTPKGRVEPMVGFTLTFSIFSF